MVAFGKAIYYTLGKLPKMLGGGLFRLLSAHLICKKVGKKVSIGKNAHFGRRVSIGNGSGIGNYSFLQGTIVINDNVMMGPECMFYTINHKTSRVDVPMCEQGITEEKPIVICDNVWIGARVIVLPGVTIGEGSIIGAGTVVTKDVPPYSVYCGNPGRVVKDRRTVNE